MGKLLIILGIGLVIAGLIIEFGVRIPFGKLPGDIRIERENFSFYFPVTTMILLSILLSAVFWIYQKLK